MYFKIEVAVCKIARYRTVPLTEFASSKDASVGVGVSAFDSTRFILSIARDYPNICSPFLIPTNL